MASVYGIRLKKIRLLRDKMTADVWMDGKKLGQFTSDENEEKLLFEPAAFIGRIKLFYEDNPQKTPFPTDNDMEHQFLQELLFRTECKKHYKRMIKDSEETCAVVLRFKREPGYEYHVIDDWKIRLCSSKEAAADVFKEYTDKYPSAYTQIYKCADDFDIKYKRRYEHEF